MKKVDIDEMIFWDYIYFLGFIVGIKVSCSNIASERVLYRVYGTSKEILALIGKKVTDALKIERDSGII